MKRGAFLLLVGYALGGVLFGLAVQPQQLWRCPDVAPEPGAPSSSGEVLYGERRGDGCTKTVTLDERATAFAVGGVLWLPLLISSALVD